MILVVGVAGSGKSTQSELLADNSGWVWLSMGQILRSAITGETADVMKTGKLIDDAQTQNILLAELNKYMPEKKVILDGFPRRPAQAQWLIETLANMDDSIEAVVHLNAHENVVLERLLSRGRQDDHKDAINERFEEYEKQIKPLLDMLVGHNVITVKVDGEKSPHEVHAQIMEGLEKAGVKL